MGINHNEEQAKSEYYLITGIDLDGKRIKTRSLSWIQVHTACQRVRYRDEGGTWQIKKGSVWLVIDGKRKLLRSIGW